MLNRVLLLTALLVMPLLLSPASVSAQERGQAQAAAASANARATGRPTTLPPGMANRPEGKALPPGIVLTRAPSPVPPEPQPEPLPEPQPEPQPEPEPDECMPQVVIINGIPTLVDCNGNPIGG